MDDAFAILMLLFALGFTGLFDLGGSEEEQEENTDSQSDDPADAPSIVPLEQALQAATVIYDDTNDADNGLVTGTDGADLLFGSLEAGGTAGVEDDSTNPNDTITAGAGNDTIVAGNGNDSVLGEAGDDQISGGSGDDTIEGGLGTDVMIGNEGTDTFVLTPEAGVTDVISDFSNTEENQDFVDMTPYFAHLGELRANFEEGTTKLKVTDDYFTDFEGTTAASFTTVTTGLPENDAPIAVDDTERFFSFQTVPTDVQMLLVEGNFANEGASGADSDPNGPASDLKISTINGTEVEPGGTVGLAPGISATVRADGLAVTVSLDPNAIVEPEGEQEGPYTDFVFTYTVDDAFGARSNVANAVLSYQFDVAA